MSATHEINGDNRLDVADRLVYLWRNFWRNLTPRTSGLNGQFWQPPRDIQLGTFSPGRCMTEGFIKKHLPSLMTRREISVLDVGCGSGRTSGLLAAAGFSGRYVGVDVDNRFSPDLLPDETFEFRFIHGDAHDLEGEGPFDLIISISALEHVDNDIALISHLGTMQASGGLQVHFVPAPAGLLVYLWHGYRQYSLAAIADGFGTAGVDVYRLGGFLSFALHFLAITGPEILFSVSLRKRWPKLYHALLAWSLRHDRWVPFFPVCHVVCRRAAPAIE